LAFRLRIAVQAQREIRAAARWWSENRPAAPDLLAIELERAFTLVATHPAIGAPAVDAGLEGVRRLHLPRIHYHLYYRARAEEVEILAFWHSRRGRPSL